MQPVQLRLSFGAPSQPVEMHLSLSGARVNVETTRPTEAWQYLSEAGANPTNSDGVLTFPAANLKALANLPQQATTTADRTLTALHTLVLHPSANALPAELTVDPDGSMWLSWHDGTRSHTEAFPPSAATALLTSELTFVASHDASQRLLAACQVPLLAGRAKVNLDGFIEINTGRPQMVESADLPGLFRIEPNRFGLALPYADAISNVPGFAWATGKPALDKGPADLPPMSTTLSTHAAADLRRLVDNLAAYRSQAVVWGSGLGRRVFALAALEALDAWPALIVTTPATVWAWQRHLALFGRAGSLTHGDFDAQIITYHDHVRRQEVSNPQAIIFDDIARPGVLTDDVVTSLRRLDGLVDAYRIAISPTWPTEGLDAVKLMSLMRPGEFRADIPIATRYPTNPTQRLHEHVSAYVASRTRTDPGNDPTEFRRSSVLQLEATTDQRKATADARERHRGGSNAALLVDTLEIVSAGPSFSLSPKIAAAVERATRSLDHGRRVVVVTRSLRTAVLVKSSLPDVDAVMHEAATTAGAVPAARAAVVRFDRDLPDLRAFEDVIVVDYPWSMGILEKAVGGPSDVNGPLSVTVLHLNGSIDNRLAMLAARRAELGSVIDQSAPPTAEEIEYLLAAAR